ncbi:hypothetical protein AB685_16885 [Bacillus sp. LL01]|uniref:4'-phosphopantetheinyl transferase family protein n=1 Tax=Bacillus sp. LL01 TaxID=1665556 RepID=UPI00064CE803|nr:4'-phosphopantetheinyl transferase superfamily protein [Bacillus sp. LL01]KMJ57104.1 hypothetical protein AB685_16885 [Bacillus sp. LL01]
MNSVTGLLKDYSIEKTHLNGKLINVFTYTALEQINDEMLDMMFKIMPVNRQISAKRYRNELDKKLCIVSYALFVLAMQKTFSIYDSYEFTFNENNKPFLKSFPGIHFNISHCKVGVACAIATEKIGVDIQDIIKYDKKLAAAICSQKEIEMMNKAVDKDLELTKIWTMKESYFKMLGTGLIEPLTDVNVYELDNFYQKINSRENYVLSVAI